MKKIIGKSETLSIQDTLEILQEKCEVTVSSNVIRIGCNSFADSNIIKIVIPPSVSYISAQAFLNCKYLTDVIIEPRENILFIESYAFEGCTSLKKLNLSKLIKFTGDTNFSDCISLPKSNMGLQILKTALKGLSLKGNQVYLNNFGVRGYLNSIVTEYINHFHIPICLDVELSVVRLDTSEFYKLSESWNMAGYNFDMTNDRDGERMIKMLIQNYEKIR